MKSMLCLTVYESKGLEFDDVILFNFFAMGEVKAQSWKLLSHIRATQGYRKELPDWIIDIKEDEEEAFVETASMEALQKFQEEKKAREDEEKARLAEEAKAEEAKANENEAAAVEEPEEIIEDSDEEKELDNDELDFLDNFRS